MIFVCLGNYEKKYTNTRHNAGRKFGSFLLSSKQEVASSRKNKYGEVWELLNGDKVVFLNCFMNESGKCLRQILKSQIPNSKNMENLCIVHDDLDLAFGEFKIQFGRGAAGHHGVESVIEAFGTKDFWRIRIGIGSPPANIPPDNFVLMPFREEEAEKLASVFESIVKELPVSVE